MIKTDKVKLAELAKIHIAKWEDVRQNIRKEINSHRGEVVDAFLESQIGQKIMLQLEELHPSRIQILTVKPEPRIDTNRHE